MKKKITTKFYNVKCEEVDILQYNFQSKIKNVLNINDTIFKRIQNISKSNDYKEGYMILSYEEYEDTIFGVFCDFSEENSIHMSNEELDSKTLSLSALKTVKIKNQAGIIRSYSYFCIKDNILLFSMPKLFKAFQKYIKWLIQDKTFVFTSMLDNIDKFNLIDIKSIEIKESYFSDNKNLNENQKEIKNKINNTKYSIFKDANNDDINIKHSNIDDYISFKILLNVDRMRLIKNVKSNKNEAILKAVIKNISSEDIIITTKDNKKYSGYDVEKKIISDIELPDKNKLPNEDDIKKELYSNIKNYKND